MYKILNNCQLAAIKRAWGELKMKKYLLLLLVLLASCRSIEYADVNADNAPNRMRVPLMDISINTDNLENVYARKRYMHTASNESVQIRRYDHELTLSDDRAANAVQIFSREARNNIMLADGEPKGYIDLKLGNREVDNKLWLRALNTAAIGTTVLLGVPFDIVTEKQVVEVTIYDKNQNLIKQYTETVESSAPVALYYGYDDRDVYEKTAADNLKKALAKIRRRINYDAPEITEMLQ